MPITQINISPKNYIHTVAGNIALKIKYHVGKHASQYGTRSPNFYLQLAEDTKNLCIANSAPFARRPEALPDTTDLTALREDAVLSICEVVASTKASIVDSFDNYMAEAYDYWRNSQEFREKRHSQAGLSEKDIVGLLTFSSESEFVGRIDPQSLHIQKNRFDVADADRYFKESGTKLVYETLKSDPEIRSLLNIGGRIDPTLYFTANEFPDRKFLSFDFQHNLRAQNLLAYGQLPSNLHFGSGYALEALRQGLSADAAFFMATSVLFTARELEEYASLFARNGFKKIIVSEGWATPIEGYDCGTIIRPEENDPKKPYLGGTVLNAHHNYVDIFREAGYEIERSSIIDSHFGDWYNIVQVVATRNKPSGRKLFRMGRS